MGLKAKDVTNADGFIVGDSIVINKDIAGKTGAINVGAQFCPQIKVGNNNNSNNIFFILFLLFQMH